MPESCTCGAQLPPDALFCHRCGKPQREIVVPDTHAQPPTHVEVEFPPHPVPPQPLPLDFHNPVAVRIAFTVAMVATLLSWMPILNIVMWAAAGFFSVFFYRRRTGHLLNVKAGARMGWITGVLIFALTTVIFTATMISGASSGSLATLFQSQFHNASDPNVQEMLKMLQTGPGLAMLVGVTLIMLFVFITLLAMAGGALGAKIVGHD